MGQNARSKLKYANNNWTNKLLLKSLHGNLNLVSAGKLRFLLEDKEELSHLNRLIYMKKKK